jgi:hypothetical protein
MVDKNELLNQILFNNVIGRLENLEKRFKTESTDITYLETTMDTMKSKETGLILATLNLCVQINEDNLRKEAERLLSSATTVATEPSRGKSQGKELTRNQTVANFKKPDPKGLLRQPSSRTLKGNKSQLNITTDEGTASTKEPKTPGPGMKRNITVANFNKTPLKHQPKTPVTADKKDDSKVCYLCRIA